ncbi:AraC family transcriptional regulator ligand-binding domain-containing protein [Pigmentiphaga aceris]|uniref:AraC family transcriptional regulator ligand-binding domain-containing protein n=1 Tax=Pigmentiphaga aceris TaxID=1940612 RepID=UPI00248288F2|nr:AraC family transcriptional regulator ligand-binding domain-containing protein [Pigmentiphaga aceris]
MARKLTFALNIGWRTLLTDFGMKHEHVLRKAALPEDLFSHSERGLDTEEYFRFWRALEQEAGDPMFPLHLVDKVSAEVFVRPCSPPCAAPT